MVDKKTVFLFPGQGAQYPGMALDLLKESPRVRGLFLLASDMMKQDMKRLIGESDAETLKQTDIAQVTVTLANLAAAAVIEDRGIQPYAVAGHSLGEYAALVTAGVMSLEICFRLVMARGAAMRDAAAQLGSGAGMAAVLGLSPKKIKALLAEWKIKGLFAANFNSPRQTVVSGTASALSKAEDRFKEAGARRVLRLQVSGPFHSPLMQAAADQFAEVLQKAHFIHPKIPFFSNVTGERITDSVTAKKLALDQITSPVNWLDEETEIQKLPIEAVMETGPGSVLSGLWHDSGSPIECHPAGKLSDLTP
jgi:[acyl-carrier-protein] S-malonyltransferase